MQKNIYLRNLFPEKIYPIKGKICLWNIEHNIKVDALFTIFYAELSSLLTGKKQDEIVVENFNIKDFFPCANDYDYETIDIVTGKKIKAKQITFNEKDYPLPKYYNFELTIMNKKDSQYNIGYQILDTTTESKIIINGKCTTSSDISLNFNTNPTEIKQIFYPISFGDEDKFNIIDMYCKEKTYE